MRSFLTLFLVCALALPAFGQEPEKARQGTFALTNARLVTVSQGTIDGGTLVIRNDRIVALGPNAEIPPDAEVIDATGLSVYPGFIDSGTQVGLAEVGSLPETRDYNEIGDLVPQMKALTAVNPNSVVIPVTRTSGVTTVLTEPSGGLLPGQAALVNLHGYTPAQMHVGGVEMVRLIFPASGRRGGWDRRSDEEIEKEAQKARDRLDEIWEQATLYTRILDDYAANPEPGRRPEYVPAMEALVPVVRGEVPLLVSVNAARDIEQALDWVAARAVPSVIFSGLAEGWRVADKLAEAGVPCLVGPVLAVPSRESDRFDKAYANAGLMHQAGVRIALRTGETENVRNLPYHAGFAVAYGLPHAEALRAVTLAPAEFFGVAGDLGSLEVGKKANLFVATGDPFETKTDVLHVFIDGYKMPMTNRQIRLYEEFLEREPGLQKHATEPVSTN